MTVFTCDGDFAGMMTCIYDAWACGRGHEHVRLQREPIRQQDLFCEYIHVDANEEKAEKVVRSIQRKISAEAYLWVFYAALSAQEDALDAIYRFLIPGFAYGGSVLSMLHEPAVMRMMELRRSVGNEAHYFREFLRFSSLPGGVYAAHFEPENDVLIPLARHFCDRMPSEHWIIVDDVRKAAAVHPRNEMFYLQRLTDEEAAMLLQSERYEDEFTALWRTFFDSIEIKERKNPACQRNMFPIRMRRHVTEFMPETVSSDKQTKV